MNNIIDAYEEFRRAALDRTIYILSTGYNMMLQGVVENNVDPTDFWHLDLCEGEVYVTINHVDGYDDMMDHTIEYSLPQHLYADICTEQDIKEYWQGVHEEYIADSQLEDLIDLILTVDSKCDLLTTIQGKMVDGVDYTLYSERLALAKSMLEEGW